MEPVVERASLKSHQRESRGWTVYCLTTDAFNRIMAAGASTIGSIGSRDQGPGHGGGRPDDARRGDRTFASTMTNAMDLRRVRPLYGVHGKRNPAAPEGRSTGFLHGDRKRLAPAFDSHMDRLQEWRRDLRRSTSGRTVSMTGCASQRRRDRPAGPLSAERSTSAARNRAGGNPRPHSAYVTRRRTAGRTWVPRAPDGSAIVSDSLGFSRVQSPRRTP